MVRCWLLAALLGLSGCGMLGSKSYCELAEELQLSCFGASDFGTEERSQCERQTLQVTSACREASTEVLQCYLDNQVCDDARADEMCGDLVRQAYGSGVCD